jgi:regulator of protease activity HflC (stomatin/prohibitin superfamily)
VPILDKIKYVQPLKEIAMEIPEQSAITLDNVQLVLDGVLYVRVVDAYKVKSTIYCDTLSLEFITNLQASYGVEDPEFAVKQLAQTTMRSEVGKIILDTVFKEREQLNYSIVGMDNWGYLDRGNIQKFRGD